MSKETSPAEGLIAAERYARARLGRKIRPYAPTSQSSALRLEYIDTAPQASNLHNRETLHKMDLYALFITPSHTRNSGSFAPDILDMGYRLQSSGNLSLLPEQEKNYLPLEASIIDRRYIKSRFHHHKTSWVSTTTVYLLSYTHAGQTYEVQLLNTKEPHLEAIIDLSKNIAHLYIHRDNPSDAQFELKADFRYFHLGLGLILNAVTWVMISALIADWSR